MTLELSLALAMEIIIALRHITRKSLYVVAEEHPLKQGLKLELADGYGYNVMGCRGTSIKTRIETCYPVLFFLPSIRVAEEHPLKQGLKLAR